ncbi:hypothetical protein [Paenibacillus sp. HGF5]|uniref:hypothetical protein n=1 Tax=Paenibacillus sp. HGF5 TaxID=908341 RepID=UPI0002071D0C|nr:hypothetical protein [Paenibacillus sp. HGF5]EGG36242.1 hypothetical protein HMPREF9412_4050 [Paenibacillus sp. HGF5]
MEIVLQPKQAAAVKSKAKEIREKWDGMSTELLTIPKVLNSIHWGCSYGEIS